MEEPDRGVDADAQTASTVWVTLEAVNYGEMCE
jgi:hypothetical protein